MRCAVIGLGYVGLLEAKCLVDKGFEVVGIDNNTKVLDNLSLGKSHITGISDLAVKDMIQSGRFSLTSDYCNIKNVNVITICVPTPLDENGEPDLSMVKNCGSAMCPYLQNQQLIVLESTSYPGTTRDILKPILEKGGKIVGKDIFLAFSPERIDPGNSFYSFNNTPKLVGGIDRASAEKAAAFFEKAIDAEVKIVSSCETAEMSKMVENTFRYINIAFMDEVSLLCKKMNVDVFEVVKAASSKPYGFIPFYPNIHIGGHCIAIDPLYLLWVAKQNNVNMKLLQCSKDLLEDFYNINLCVIKDILARINKTTPQILIIGVTYKDYVADLRESPALKLINSLNSCRCHVSYYDELIPTIAINGKMVNSKTDLTDEVINNSDIIIVHNNQKKCNIKDKLCDYKGYIIDFRKLLNKETSPYYYSL